MSLPGQKSGFLLSGSSLTCPPSPLPEAAGSPSGAPPVGPASPTAELPPWPGPSSSWRTGARNPGRAASSAPPSAPRGRLRGAAAARRTGEGTRPTPGRTAAGTGRSSARSAAVPFRVCCLPASLLLVLAVVDHQNSRVPAAVVAVDVAGDRGDGLAARPDPGRSQHRTDAVALPGVVAELRLVVLSLRLVEGLARAVPVGVQQGPEGPVLAVHLPRRDQVALQVEESREAPHAAVLGDVSLDPVLVGVDPARPLREGTVGVAPVEGVARLLLPLAGQIPQLLRLLPGGLHVVLEARLGGVRKVQTDLLGHLLRQRRLFFAGHRHVFSSSGDQLIVKDPRVTDFAPLSASVSTTRSGFLAKFSRSISARSPGVFAPGYRSGSTSYSKTTVTRMISLLIPSPLARRVRRRRPRRSCRPARTSPGWPPAPSAGRRARNRVRAVRPRSGPWCPGTWPAPRGRDRCLRFGSCPASAAWLRCSGSGGRPEGLRRAPDRAPCGPPDRR